MDKQNNDNLTEKIMKQIKTDKIKMKPVGYFVLKTIIFTFAICLLILLDIFLVSFVFFAWQVAGLSIFLLIIFFLIICLIGLTWFLLEKIPYFCRKCFLAGLVFLLVSIFLTSWLVLQTSFHQKMLDISNQNNILIISPFYKAGCGCGCQK